jgi:hypothetical protein
VLIDDLVDIGNCIGPVPNPLGVDHDHGPKLAEIKATGLIDPYIIKAQCLAPALEMVTQGIRPLSLAAAARMAFLALIYTAKHVKSEGRAVHHGSATIHARVRYKIC